MATANYPTTTGQEQPRRTRGGLKMPDQPDPSRIKDPTAKTPEECGQIAVIASPDGSDRVRVTCAERKGHGTARKHRAIISVALPLTKARATAELTWTD